MRYLRYRKPHFLLLILGAFYLFSVGSASAQVEPPAEPLSPRAITFEQLGEGEVSLEDNDTSASFTFRLPGDWIPQEGSFLELGLTYISVRYNRSLEGEAEDEVIPGVLQVWLNDVNIGSANLESLPADGRVRFDIQPEIWQRPDSTGRHEFRFDLITSVGCLDEVEVLIAPDSLLQVAFSTGRQRPFTLEEYPTPFLQDSFGANSLLFVLPAQPTAAELEAASAVAAFLGLRGVTAPMTSAIPANAFDPATHGNQNVIIVGSIHNNDLVRQVAEERVLSLDVATGIVLFQASPWNTNKGVLIVSGLDDEGVSLAARALSTEDRTPALRGNSVVVTDAVSTLPDDIPRATGSFSSLGYGTRTSSGTSSATFTYDFAFTEGFRAQEGGYIDLRFAHAVPLSSASSLDVTVNGVPVGGTQLNDSNSDDGHLLISLPNELEWWRGKNEVTVRAEMAPPSTDLDCRPIPLTEDWPWVTIFDTSAIFVEPIPGSRRLIALEDFPRAFVGDSRLETLTFVLPETPQSGSLTAFLQLSVTLGDEADGDAYVPNVVLGMPPVDPPGDLVIVIGRSSVNPYIAGLNDILLQPFDPSTDALVQANNPVQFELSPEQAIGTIELIIPSSGVNVATLVLTGTSEESIAWAGRALVERELQREVEGNLAYVLDREIYSFAIRRPGADGDVGGAEAAAQGSGLAEQESSAEAGPMIGSEQVEEGDSPIPGPDGVEGPVVVRRPASLIVPILVLIAALMGLSAVAFMLLGNVGPGEILRRIRSIVPIARAAGSAQTDEAIGNPEWDERLDYFQDRSATDLSFDSPENESSSTVVASDRPETGGKEAMVSASYPYTNRQVLVAFYQAAYHRARASRGRRAQDYLTLAGLDPQEMAAHADDPYSGPPIKDLPNLDEQFRADVSALLRSIRDNEGTDDLPDMT